MRQVCLAICGLGLAMGTSSAQAAALERAVPSSRVLFEPGRYMEFSLTYSDPDQSGDGGFVPLLLGGPLAIPGSTGDVFDPHTDIGFAYKSDLTDRTSYALIFNQPYGANTTYEGGFYDGTEADLETQQITAMLAFDATPAVKVYAGLRAQRMEADAAIPFIGPSAGLPAYTIETDTDYGYGWLIGAAYQRPEMALRVALTYWSEIDHGFDTTEFGGLVIPGAFDGNTRTDITTPQSASLEFQSGVAPDTLVFGSVRWVNWADFEIAPPAYVLATGGRALVDYEEDWWTYTLGLGRRFNDSWSGTVSLTYEPESDTELTTLGPYDGRKSATAALVYTRDAFSITGGVTYGLLGDTDNVLATDYNDGSVLGAGLRVGWSF